MAKCKNIMYDKDWTRSHQDATVKLQWQSPHYDKHHVMVTQWTIVRYLLSRKAHIPGPILLTIYCTVG